MPVDTKQMIVDAFAQMAQRKPVDKITVKDLVAACGISRQAFYYHFQDMTEVMAWSIEQMVQQALQQSLEADGAEAALEAFIHLSDDHKQLLEKLLSSQRHMEVERIFVQAMRASVYQVLSQRKPDLALDRQDLEVMLNFYAYGIAGVVFENGRHNTMDVRVLSHKLLQLLSGRMLKL